MTPPDEEQLAKEKLGEIFEYATKLIDRSGTPGGFSIAPGSPLAGDDKHSTPFQVSHAVKVAITTAADHLHALCALVLNSGFLHVAAPATLARGALECAAAAIWIASPNTRDDRIEHALRWYMKDVKDGDKAATEGGLTVPTPLQDRKDKIEAVADARSVPFSSIKTGYTSTEAVEAARAHLKEPIDVLLYWRLCSGFAHGRAWPALGFADVLQKVPTSDPKVVNIKVESSYSLVLVLGMAAALTVKAAVELYEQRGSAPTP